MGATFDDKGVVVSATVSCDDGQKRCISCTALVAAMGPWTGRAKDWGGAFSQIPPVEGLKAHSIVMKSEGVSPVAVFCNFPGEDGKEKEVEFYPRPNGTTYWCGEADDWHAPVTEEPGHVTPDPNAVAKLIQRGSGRAQSFWALGLRSGWPRAISRWFVVTTAARARPSSANCARAAEHLWPPVIRAGVFCRHHRRGKRSRT